MDTDQFDVNAFVSRLESTESPYGDVFEGPEFGVAEVEDFDPD